MIKTIKSINVSLKKYKKDFSKQGPVSISEYRPFCLTLNSLLGCVESAVDFDFCFVPHFFRNETMFKKVLIEIAKP